MKTAFATLKGVEAMHMLKKRAIRSNFQTFKLTDYNEGVTFLIGISNETKTFYFSH